MAKSLHKARYSMMQIMILKVTTQETFWVLRDFSSNDVSNCSIRWRFFTKQVFFKCYFKIPCFQVPQNEPWTDEMTRVISASSGINGESLAPHILNKHREQSF